MADQPPKLNITLYPPKREGTRYVANGSLAMNLTDARLFAEWLMTQEGEMDDYSGNMMIKIPAFQYENTSKAGKPYTTVQVVHLDDSPQQLPPAQARAATFSRSGPPSRPAPARQPDPIDQEIPF